MLTFDHIALGARDLEKSTQALSDMLGAAPFGGGEHDLFGTHNKLWRIETPKYPIYLELLTINPNGQPKRPRWFGLETPIDDDDIHLLGFVAGTSDIRQTVAHAPFDALTPIDVARGDLRWKFGISDDGYLLENGALPYLIEWQDNRHPLDGRAPQGILLTEIGGSALSQLSLDWPVAPKTGGSEIFSVTLQGAHGSSHRFVRS
jgi:hypothetical protein